MVQISGQAAWPEGRHGIKAGQYAWGQAGCPGSRSDVLGAGRMSGEIPLTMPGENVMMRKTSIFRQTRW